MAVGVQGPGFRNQLLTFFEAGDTVITKNGLFIYNGTPGPGNPPILYGVPVGVVTDPFGNALDDSFGGLSSVRYTSGVIQQLAQLSAGSLILLGGPVAAYSAPNGITVNNGGDEMTIAPPTVPGHSAPFIDLIPSGTGDRIINLGTDQVVINTSGAGPATTAELEVAGSLNVNAGLGGANKFSVGTGPSDFQGTVFIEDGATPVTPSTASAVFSKAGQLFYVGEDGNLYATGACELQAATNQLFNSVTLTPVNGHVAPTLTFNTQARAYTLHLVLAINTTAAAGTPILNIVSTGTTSNNRVMVTWKQSAPGVAGNVSVNTNATNTSFAGPTLVAADFIIVEADVSVTFTSVGTLTVKMACSIAADTFTVLGGYARLQPSSA